ncbi:hypothetical protein MESS2_p70011 [Mesorhizobium metallidurans STM 2683]|uniref:Uncharacterized protein n=1 Tax=Mesorhizobium metallidurans STM 2683 TaxID=1297569 RepID=M5EZF1_9HYPH|nr:hypothetical protein MESS2_p70011 [Mesorhizobium metallidurans STM 2683]
MTASVTASPSDQPGEGRGFSQPGRLGEIDPEAVTPPLIPTGHLGAGMAELLLHIAFIDLGRGGEASTPMSGKNSIQPRPTSV